MQDASYHNQQETFDPLKFLMLLDQNNPDENSVIGYLNALYKAGQATITPQQFYQQGSLEFWKSAISFRPKDKHIPISVDLLPIASILYNALTPFYCHVMGKNIITMNDRIDRAANILQVWLQEQGGEDRETKRKRLNREAQKRHQLRLKAAAKAPEELSAEEQHALAVKKAYDEFKEACDQRSEAIKQWDLYVASKQKAWKDLKAKGGAV